MAINSADEARPQRQAKNILDTGVPVPPAHIGTANMRKKLVDPDLTGPELLDQIRLFCPLHPGMTILDVGCGLGRLGLSFADYLDGDGRYEGYDIDEVRMSWCRDEITSRYPNLRFTTADLHNGMYNDQGSVESTASTFPYPDDTFDLVFLNSVFTHMLPDDVAHYLREISRVQRVQGSSWISFLLITEPARPETHRRFGGWTLSDDGAYHYQTHTRSVEGAVAYDEQWVRDRYADAGLTIDTTVYGNWRGGLPTAVEASPAELQDWARVTRHNDQDILISHKS